MLLMIQILHSNLVPHTQVIGMVKVELEEMDLNFLCHLFPLLSLFWN